MNAPDGCPVHELACRDPGATIQLYDEQRRYLGPCSAERACAGHHAGLDEVMRRAVQGWAEGHLPSER